MTLIGKLDEFEVSAQSGRASFSISANSFCFSARSSVTVSTAMSMADQSASGRVANVFRPDVSVGLLMAASALAHAAGNPSRVEAERETTSTFQPPARNMAMMPTPMVPPPSTRACLADGCSRCGIFLPPNLDGPPRRGARSPFTYNPQGKTMSGTYKDIGVTSEGHVGVVEIQRPPHNFFDNSLINQIADAFEAFDRDGNIRAYVLCAQGKSFCAGADFANRPQTGAAESGKHLYKEATRLFRSKKPSVGAIQGPAIGGGLGLALMPDFRVAAPEARFAANFTRLGFHPGFSLTFTLPRLIGQQKANLMFYTGRRIGGEQAYEWGLADVLVPLADVRKEAMKLAGEIAESAPLAILSTRETMRRGFADGAEMATERELVEQDWLRKTEDFKEGIKSYAERRPGNWKGR